MRSNRRSVFISNASSDKDWAEACAQSVRRLGHHVSVDWDVAGAAEAAPQEVERRLRESNLIVVLAPSGDPRNPKMYNPKVYFEIGAALGMGAPVVLVWPDD